jgi:hypothetical protein
VLWLADTEVTAMSRPRQLLLALALLAVLTPLTAPLGIAWAAQNPNKPIVEYVDVTFQAPNLTRECGFDVYANVVGTVTFKVLPNGVELVRFRYEHIFSGPGGSVTVKRAENVKYTATLSEDGTLVETFTLTGTLMYHMVVPGYGSIGNNSGREVFRDTWQYDEDADGYVLVDSETLFDAGPNDELDDADFEVICGLLA